MDALAVALGDPAGIGPEIIAQAWAQRAEAGLAPFFAIGDQRSLRAVWDGPITIVSGPDEAARVFDGALPLIQVDDPGEIVPGEPNLAGARCALDSLEIAVGLTRAGSARAVVTGPVSKAQLYAIGFTHPGQTEFIAERCGMAAGNPVMMLAGPSLRTVPITIHTPLSDVASQLTTELIVSRARVAARGLQRDFGIAAPRLAVAGLNPHLTHFNRAAIIHHLRAHSGVLRKPAAAEHRPVLLEHTRGVSRKAVDHRADRAAFLRRGREDFTPVGAAHFASARQIHFARLQLIERFRQSSERLPLRPVHIDHQDRHRAPGHLHVLAHRLDRLRQKLMRKTQRIQDVAHDGRVQFAPDQIEQLRIGFPFRHKSYFGARLSSAAARERSQRLRVPHTRLPNHPDLRSRIAALKTRAL